MLIPAAGPDSYLSLSDYLRLLPLALTLWLDMGPQSYVSL